MSNLPKEFVNFLKAGKQLSYDPDLCECGKVKLKDYSDLTIGYIYFDNTKNGNKSHFAVPAISLLETCEFYNPDFILLWLPNEKMFGTWDEDHWEMKVFENINWSEIIKEPIKFLNTQWDGSEHEWARFWKPGPTYKAVDGWPF